MAVRNELIAGDRVRSRFNIERTGTVEGAAPAGRNGERRVTVRWDDGKRQRRYEANLEPIEGQR